MIADRRTTTPVVAAQSEDGSIELLGAIIGGLIAFLGGFAAARYQDALADKRVQAKVGGRLASIAVHVRRALVEQFVSIADATDFAGTAFEVQRGLHDELGALLPELEEVGAETYAYALSAYESLGSSMTDLIRTAGDGQPRPRKMNLGPTDTSHHDLWAAVQLIDLSVRALPDADARRRSLALAQLIRAQRETARLNIITGVERLQAMSEEQREAWIRLGE